jgi:hypothetical protein
MMIVGVQGTKGFRDYQVFLRAMGVALSSMSNEDKELNIYSVGPSNINSMATEFTNLSERGMRSRGKKIKLYKVPVQWLEENMSYVNYFAFLGSEGERSSRLASVAESMNIETGIFRY